MEGRRDVLVNMTNDGWFRGSSELDQHLDHGDVSLCGNTPSNGSCCQRWHFCVHRCQWSDSPTRAFPGDEAGCCSPRGRLRNCGLDVRPCHRPAISSVFSCDVRTGPAGWPQHLLPSVWRLVRELVCCGLRSVDRRRQKEEPCPGRPGFVFDCGCPTQLHRHSAVE